MCAMPALFARCATLLPGTTAALQDTDSVVNSLEVALAMLVHFITIALYLLVFGVNIVQGWETCWRAAVP